MTKKDLFKIILKLYGLYSFIVLILQIPNITFYLYYDSINEFNWLVLSAPVVSLTIVFILIYKPILFINWFKLDKGFENDEIATNVSEGKGITKIALIIIAVHLIVSNISAFISQVLFSFKDNVASNNLENLIEPFNPYPVNYQIMINSAISLLVGYLLLTNQKRISKWIEKINDKNL